MKVDRQNGENCKNAGVCICREKDSKWLNASSVIWSSAGFGF